MTQNGMILNHLQTVGGITAKEAVELYGCYRLSARIADLKEAGFKIKTTTESGKNRFGETSHWVRYWL